MIISKNKISLFNSRNIVIKLNLEFMSSQMKLENFIFNHSWGKQFFAVNIRLHNKAIKINFVHVFALNLFRIIFSQNTSRII